MSKLKSKTRKRMKRSSFAVPSKRKYPIHDRSHARNALARVSQHGTPAEKTRVRKAVARKYNMGPAAKKKTSRRRSR